MLFRFHGFHVVRLFEGYVERYVERNLRRFR